MTDLVAQTNEALAAGAPALAACLSPLGRRLAFPPDIPFQAAQARGKAFNATIGQITDGSGRALPLSAIAGGLSGLAEVDRNRALLYAPVEGIAELRERWRAWQRARMPAALVARAPELPSSLPIVVDGLTHGLAIVADLFGADDRPLVVPRPFWGNYRQTFTTRTGSPVLSAPAYVDGRFDPLAWERALAGESASSPAIALVNSPSNPGGYTPNAAERSELLASLLRIADRRPLVVLCDDAYAGLVFDEAPAASIFWDLVAAKHPRLVPVKVDGATKELLYFGGRIGFVTFAVEPGTPAHDAIESKVKCLVRAVVGSPVATSEVLMLQALRDLPTAEAEIAATRELLAGRWRALTAALGATDRALLRPLPCNSGCFSLVELPEELGITAEQVRQHLLAHHDVGIVSIQPRFVRIAFCSVAEAAIPELVRRLELGVRELAAAAKSS
jgi:aspartate/methionine/tyrosine aminotransferase